MQQAGPALSDYIDMQHQYSSYYQEQQPAPIDTAAANAYMAPEFCYNGPSTSAHGLESTLFSPVSHLSYTQPQQQPLSPFEGNSSSTASSYTSAVSPNSLGSGLRTPITPFSLASPTSFKDAQSQESWFSAMQDSYMAGQQAAASSAVHRMQRMSISAPLPSTDQRPYDPTIKPLLNVAQNPPRRASVVTFQPTPSRPSSMLRRGSVQPTSNSDPAMRTRTDSRPPLKLNVPSQNHVQFPVQHQPQRPSPTPIQSATVAPVNEVDKLFAEVFAAPSNSYSTSPMQTVLSQPTFAPMVHSPMTGTMQHAHQPGFEQGNINFSGVLLQPEDLHMLGPDSLVGAQPTMMPHIQLQQQASPGWQSTFSFGTPTVQQMQPQMMMQQQMQPRLQPMMLPVQGQNTQWNFSTFHGFEPIVTPNVECTSYPFERSSSAPLQGEDLPPATLGPINTMDRRRGSSIDTPALLPYANVGSNLSTVQTALASPSQQFMHASPAYLGPGPARPSSSSLANRRATVGPSPINAAGSAQRAAFAPYPSPPKSASGPLSALPSPPSPTRRMSATKGTSRRGSTAATSSAPLFINFTSKDANKLLSGVAPSGSSKRKREEEEQAKMVKQNKAEATSSA